MLFCQQIQKTHSYYITLSQLNRSLFSQESAYDTIQYDIFAQKLTKGQLSLSHGTETKNKEKQKQKPISSEEMVQAKVREGTKVGMHQTRPSKEV